MSLRLRKCCSLNVEAPEPPAFFMSDGKSASPVPEQKTSKRKRISNFIETLVCDPHQGKQVRFEYEAHPDGAYDGDELWLYYVVPALYKNLPSVAWAQYKSRFLNVRKPRKHIVFKTTEEQRFRDWLETSVCRASQSVLLPLNVR